MYVHTNPDPIFSVVACGMIYCLGNFNSGLLVAAEWHFDRRNILRSLEVYFHTRTLLAQRFNAHASVLWCEEDIYYLNKQFLFIALR